MTQLLSNWTLQKAFVWTLSAKILSATLAVLLNSTWFFGFFLPLSFMLVYMWYGNKKTKDSGHSMRQSYGDSCYYLGFLFTVASLIAALFVLGLHDNLETAELAIRFAAAMVTTLLGMFVRVYMVTFARNEDDSQMAAIGIVPQQISPGDSYEVRVQANLDNLRTLNEVLINNIDSAEKMRMSLQSLVSRVQSDLEEMTKDTKKYLVTLTKGAASTLEKTQEKFNASIDQNVQETADQMKRLVEASAESTKHYVQEALKGVEMTSKASAEVVRESAQIVVQDFNESAADRVNTFAKHVESLGQSIETFSQQLSQARKPLDVLESSAHGLSNTLNNEVGLVVSQTKSSVETVNNHLTNLNQTMQTSTETVRKIVDDANVKLSRNLEETARMSGEINKTIAADVDSLRQNVRELSTHVEKLTSEAEKTATALEKNREKKGFFGFLKRG